VPRRVKKDRGVGYGLELKLLADVGLIGFPMLENQRFSPEYPRPDEDADYPFTTLVPNLGGGCDREDHRPFVVADIPGLIEGASKGAGLGLTFLRHVERTRLLISPSGYLEGLLAMRSRISTPSTMN